MRRPPLAASLTLAAALATAAPTHAAVVHGLEHSPRGAATLTVTGSGFADRALEVGNLGSSGQDGVAIALPGSSGLSVTFGVPLATLHENIVHRDLALRSLVSGTPVTHLELHADQVGPDCVVSASSPGALSMRVDIWDGDQLRYSVHHPPGTPVTFTATSLEEPMEQAAYKTACCCNCNVTLIKLTRSVGLQITGVPVTGTGVVFTFEMGADPPPATEAEIRCATDPMSEGVGGVMHLSQVLVTTGEPPGTPGTLPASLDVVSGALLSASPSGGISVSPDGTGDPVAVSLNGLPPGEPVIEPLQSAGATLDASYMSGAGPATMTLQCTTQDDDGSGLPPVPTTDAVSWSASPTTMFDFAVSRGMVGLSSSVLVLAGGLETARSPEPFSLSTSSPPVSLRAEVLHGAPMMCFGFPPGTTALCNGVPVPCDSAVIPLPFGGTAWNRKISDIRIVHPPGTPPGTWRAFHVTPADQFDASLGSPIGVTGGPGSFAKEAPKDTTKKPVRLIIHNLGSSGEDGAEIRMPAGGSIGLQLPVDNAALEHARTLDIKEYPCAGLDCDFTARLLVQGLHGELSAAKVRGVMSSAQSNPLYVEAAGQVVPFSHTDPDGDGDMELSPTVPDGVRVDRIELRRWAPRVQSQSVHFADPVIITIRGDAFVTSEVTLWRNRGGGTSGTDAPMPVAVTLNGLPPGEPVIGFPGVCDLEMGPPLVPSAGPDVGAPGVASSFNGHPIVPTWVSVSGDLEIGDLDGDGFPELLSNNPHAAGADWMPGTVAVDFRSANPLGALVQFGALVSGPVEHPHTFEVDLTATRGIAVDIRIPIVVLDDSIGPPTMEMKLPEPGASLVWSPRSNLVSQGTLVGPGTLQLSALPTTLEFVGDPDGDGMPDLRAAGFPPGTECVLDGVPHPCDEVIVACSGSTPVDALTGLRMRVHGLHRGERLHGLRVAEFATPPAITGVAPPSPHAALTLSAPAPNPFAASTAIAFALNEAARVRVRVLDVAGREVARIADARFEAGPHRLEWDGRNAAGRAAAAGLYFVRVERDGGVTQVARVARLR